LNPTENEIHSLFRYDALQSYWRILVITDSLGKVTCAVLDPSTKHLVNSIVFILKEKTRLILLRIAKISNLIMLRENNTMIKWIGLILDNSVEPFDAIINILSLFLGCSVARLVLEGAGVPVLE